MYKKRKKNIHTQQSSSAYLFNHHSTTNSSLSHTLRPTGIITNSYSWLSLKTDKKKLTEQYMTWSDVLNVTCHQHTSKALRWCSLAPCRNTPVTCTWHLVINTPLRHSGGAV